MRPFIVCFLTFYLQNGVFAQGVYSNLNSWPAPSMEIGMREPLDLGEAAGRYLTTVEILREKKRSKCGYSLKSLNIPSFDEALVKYVGPRVPESQREKFIAVTKTQRKFIIDTAISRYGIDFTHLVQNEGLDHNTACGWLAGSVFDQHLQASRYLEKRRLTPK
jgi:hypothetical protein